MQDCETGFKQKTIITEEDFTRLKEKYEIPEFEDVDSGDAIFKTIRYIVKELEQLLK